MIVLCSSSPTRAKILQNFGVDFVQKGCEFDEDSLQTKTPKTFVYEAVKGKFHCCKKRFGLDMPLLAADTVVEHQGQILRKAKDMDEARRMLKLQSGSKVSIMSALMFESKEFFISDISTTVYELHSFDEDDLNRYLQSGLWQGKAGAIMVEGFCKKYIKSVRGFESTAMGLQVEKILPYIK